MSKVHKKRFRLWILLVLVILAAVLISFLLLGQRPPEEITMTYTENEKALDNPARGYYIQVQAGEYDRYEAMEEDGIRLALLAFDIKKYAGLDIPEDKLDTLRLNLEEARKHHINIVFRAAYGFWGDCEEPAAKEGFAGHIRQISQVINDYRDIVISVQAGLLGPYGEWHHGSYLSEDKGAEESNREIRLYILSEWEKNLDPSIPVAVRRPRFIREALSEGILHGRLGYHNDGLLGSDSDLGTYDDPEYNRDEELQWMDKELASQVNGGEMPTVSSWNDPDNTDREFSGMHVTYLNLMYNREVLDKWKGMEYKGQNAEEYISSHLGYRLFVSEVTALDYWKKGPLSIRFKLTNSGYGPLPEKYRLYMVLKGGGSSVSQELETEELYTISCGEWTEARAEVEIPGSLLQKVEGEELQIGIMIAKTAEETDEKEWIKLANDELSSNSGVYQIAAYEYNKDKKTYKLK